MLQLIAVIAMLAIAIYGIISVFTMSDSPNPNCFQDNDQDTEINCPFMRQQNDQGNTERE